MSIVQPVRQMVLTKVHLAQVLLAAALVAAWQYLPDIGFLSSRFKFLDRFFISSPSAVVGRIRDLLVGTDAYQSVAGPLWLTVRDSLIGLAIGIVAGSLLGLVLSASPTGSAIFRPFVVLFSAIPRVALIPVIVIALGPTSRSSIFNAATIVFFVVFFNAFEGGRTVKAELLDNAYLLGASTWVTMLRVRLPYVLAWTIVAFPAATGYGLVGSVVTEILVGIPGMGQQLIISLEAVDATSTFGLAILLAILGVVMTAIATVLRSRLLFWWEGGRS
jgi:NitT/TauT family transport system permease protein